MQESYRKGELAKYILKAFVVSGIVVTCVVLPGMAPILKFIGATDSRQRDRVRQSVKTLEKRGYITRTIKNGKEMYSVTSKGEQKISAYLVEDLKIKRPHVWDKKWRVLMFDIPEVKGRVRREVSWKLKDIGMHAIQNSVFISPFSCKKEINLIMSHYFVEKYCIYMEVGFIELKEDILKKFGLK